MIGKWLAAKAGDAALRGASVRPGPFVGVQSMVRGEGWQSDNGRAVLVLDAAGNLALVLDGRKAWSPPKAGGATKLLLDGKGQLTLWRDHERAWVVGSPRAPAAEFRVQDDGNLVLYDRHTVIWTADTRL